MTTTTEKMICHKCKRSFDESKIAEVSYVEYAGASSQVDFVSPCCGAGYQYADEDPKCPSCMGTESDHDFHCLKRK
jgi:hypothetical protein